MVSFGAKLLRPSPKDILKENRLVGGAICTSERRGKFSIDLGSPRPLDISLISKEGNFKEGIALDILANFSAFGATSLPRSPLYHYITLFTLVPSNEAAFATTSERRRRWTSLSQRRTATSSVGEPIYVFRTNICHAPPRSPLQ